MPKKTTDVTPAGGDINYAVAYTGHSRSTINRAVNADGSDPGWPPLKAKRLGSIETGRRWFAKTDLDAWLNSLPDA